MAHHVRHITSRQRPHGCWAQIADGVGQDDHGMPWHAFGAELELRGVFEGLRNDHGSWDSLSFKGDRVVHTAQRARTSAADGGNGHLHVLCHGRNDRLGGGLRIVCLATHHDPGDPVPLL
jgi:hypothetical protein